MPFSEVILASSVPALTKTIVPKNIPSWLTQKKVQAFMVVRPITTLIMKNGKAGTRRSVNK